MIFRFKNRRVNQYLINFSSGHIIRLDPPFADFELDIILKGSPSFDFR